MKKLSAAGRSCAPQQRYGAGNHLLLAGVVTAAIIGIAVGYYSAPAGKVKPSSPASSPSEPASRSDQLVTPSPGIARNIQQFALSRSDMSDNIEAPALTITESDEVVLAWATETGPEERKVMLATSIDGARTFNEPQAVITTGIHRSVAKMRGREITRKMRTLPHLGAAGDTLYLAWVDAGETRESVVLSLATSQDGGKTFSEPVAVHQNRDARPTFTSLHVSDDHTVVCSWLDNRNRVQQPFAAVRWPGQQEFEREQLVYAGRDEKGICPCCPTMAFASDDDIFVTFRGNEGGFRDMWTARMEPGSNEFAAPVAMVSPTWEFAGCPHDGPSVCETSRGLHVAWMDAHDGAERVYVGRPAGNEPPTAIGDTTDHATTLGHPHLVTHADILHLVWDQSLAATTSRPAEIGKGSGTDNSTKDVDSSESGEMRLKDGAHSHASHLNQPTGGRAIYYAKSHDGGQTFSEPVAVAPAEAHFQTRPRMCVSSTGTLVVSWMELTESDKSVVVATLGPTPSAVPVEVTHSGADE